MKVFITLKDPDGFSYCLREAVEESIEGEPIEDREAVLESREEELRALLSKWFEYSEYLTVEVDTETKTIKVVEN